MGRLVTVDVSGATCPLPLLRAKSALKQMDVGDVLKLIATDKQAHQDVVRFCSRGQCKILNISNSDIQYIFLIEKC